MEAHRAQLYSSTEKMKPKFLRLNSKTEPKPEKIWVDKGRGFAGEFSQLCRKIDIELYSTRSETKLGFVERNIRTLIAIISKFMHENNTDMHIEILQQSGNVISCRVNSTTKLAPNDVEKNDVPHLISLQTSNQIREPKYKIGQQVRIKRKIELFHRSYCIQFTEEVFTITAMQTLNPPTYTIKDASNQLIQGKVYEFELTLFQKKFLSNYSNRQPIKYKVIEGIY